MFIEEKIKKYKLIDNQLSKNNKEKKTIKKTKRK